MKIKSKVMGFALALGAAIAPLATKATTETNAAPKTVEVARAEKAQKLKEAIHLGLSREELLKYVDFPEWMPVTKEGAFDKKAAERSYDDLGLSDAADSAFIKYVDAIGKGANSDIEFQKFIKTATGNDKEKMEKLTQIKEVLQKTQEQTGGKFEIPALNSWWMTPFGVLLAYGYAMSSVVKRMVKRNKETQHDNSTLSLSTVSDVIDAIGLTVIVAMPAILGHFNNPNRDLKTLYVNAHEQVYNAHINREVQQAANPEIVQMDMKQAKQFIEFAKQNSSVK